MKAEDVEEIRVRPVDWDGPTIATASVRFSMGLVLRGLSIIEYNGNKFVSFPSRKTDQVDEKTGKTKYFDYVFFLDKEDKEAFQELILDKYYSEISSAGDENEETEYYH